MRTDMRFMVLLLVGALSLYGTGCRRSNEKSVQAAGEVKPNDSTVLTQTDKDFLTDAEKAQLQEQAAARLAKIKTRNDDVKDYAEMMDHDHASALDDTVDLMKKYNVTQPSDLVNNDATAKLNTVNGPAFDQMFMNMMVTDHQKAIQQFQSEAATTQNDDVRDYTKDLLPTLQRHLERAIEIQNKLSGVKKTTSR